MTAGTDGIVDKLREEETRLRSQHAEALKTARSIEAELVRVRDAIRALLGEGFAGTSNDRRSSGLKNTFTNEEVMELLEKLLAEEVLSVADANERVGDLATKQGRSKSGLHFRVKRALKDDRFVANGDGYSLRPRRF